MTTQEVSPEFPDADYIPFTKGELILNDLVDVNIKSLGELIGADCWGVYIRHENRKITALYNAYPYKMPRDVPDWLNAIRTEMIDNFDSAVLSKMEAGDTLVILMFGVAGWAAYATLLEDDTWRFKFRRDVDYGKGISPQHDTVFTIKGYASNGSQDTLSLNESMFTYIVGEITKLAVGNRRYLEIHMRNDAVFTLTFEPNLAIGGCAEHHEIRTIVEYYGEGASLPCEPDVRLETDYEDGYKLKDWIDRHSRHLFIY